MNAYWFSRLDGTTAHQTEPARIGIKQTFDGDPIPCKQGLHSSPTPFDALRYARGPLLWEVEIPDDAVPHGDPVDKYAAQWRLPIRCVDMTRQLREFACDCAERVLPIFEKAHPKNKRPRKAIEVARKFTRGEATVEELAAARYAAWAAARAAASDAACDAAWAAARAAARDAAWYAAWYAASDAARDAARAAARDAELYWQRDRFNRIAMQAAVILQEADDDS